MGQNPKIILDNMLKILFINTKFEGFSWKEKISGMQKMSRCHLGPLWAHITWDQVMHICVNNLTITHSDNGLSPGRRQAIIWTNAGILLIWPVGKNFSEILIEIHTFSFKKTSNNVWKLAAIFFRPQCVNELLSLWSKLTVYALIIRNVSAKFQNNLGVVAQTSHHRCTGVGDGNNLIYIPVIPDRSNHK